MASYVVQDTQLTAIASVIRTKSGTTEGMTVAEMPSKINEIKGSADPILQDKSATPSESQQNIIPDNGYDGLSSVTFAPIPSEYIVREEISEQDTLISNIMTALEGKAGGGGSSGGGSVETCTVTISSNSSNYDPRNIAYTSVDDSGKVIGVNQTVSTSSVTVTCVKGSTLAVKYKSLFNALNSPTNASLLFYSSPTAVYKLDDNATTANIANSPASGGSSN